MARVDMVLPTVVDRLAEDMATEYQRTKAPAILLLMQVEAPVDTGQLRASGRVDSIVHRENQDRIIRFWFRRFNEPPGVSVAQIIFAGRREVRPVRAKALRWVTKAGVVVFAQRSRAVPPNRWTLRVFQRLGFRDVQVRKR